MGCPNRKFRTTAFSSQTIIINLFSSETQLNICFHVYFNQFILVNISLSGALESYFAIIVTSPVFALII